METLIKELEQLAQLKTTQDTIKDKNLTVFFLLSNYFNKVYNTQWILVGGLAIAYYTKGKYTTKDIDIIGNVSEDIATDLKKLGFEKFNGVGRHYYNQALDVALEFPSSRLDGNLDSVVQINHSYIIGVNDLIKDKLRNYLYWNNPYQLIYILEIIKQQDYDITYLKKNLNSKEYEMFEKVLSIEKETNINNLFEYDLLSFNEKSENPINYSLYKQDNLTIFSIPCKQYTYQNKEYESYIGIVLDPLITLMGYTEDTFEPLENINLRQTTSYNTDISFLKTINNNVYDLLKTYLKERTLEKERLLDILDNPLKNDYS